VSAMFPRTRIGTFGFGLLLVDLPFLVAVLIAGFWFGFAHTYTAITDWRLAHPWSFAPSIVVAVVLVIRWRRAR
jgi:hypothetical protein